MPDLLLENGRIVDGTGAPWFRGSVGVTDGMISGIVRGRTDAVDAEERLDVDGSVICPGFIDAHSHSDLELFSDPTLAPKTRQGVTTEILGQDGFSMAPMHGDADAWEEYLSGLAGRLDRDWSWETTPEYLDAIEESGVAANVATLVGHGTVRYNVLGMEDVEPSEADLDAMADQITAALDAGAVGLSTGLVYTPQVYADTEEVRRLARALAPYGRPFVAHIRSEGRWIWEAMDEFVDVGAEEGVPLHISHFKVSGREQSGKASRLLELVETARERGVDVTADQYPYTAGSTMLSALLPPWLQSMGPDRTLEALGEADVRERIRRDVEEWRIDGWENVAGKAGWENIDVTNLSEPGHEDIEGMSIADIAEAWDDDPVSVMCDVLVAEELEASIIVHVMIEPDVRTVMGSERVAVGTDGLFGGRPHPRVYGSYPRVLGRYVRNENHLTLAEAVRKMTSLPARAMGLDGKGVVRRGMDADLVVFDPGTVEDRATFDDPERYPVGVEHVLVNGTSVVEDGELTGELPGVAVRA